MMGLAEWIESGLTRFADSTRERLAPAGEAKRANNDSAFLLGHALPFGSLGPPPGTPVTITQDQAARHVLAVGGSGGGKSTFQRRMMDWDHSHAKTTLSLDFLGDGVEGNLRQIASRSGDRPDVYLVDLGDPHFIPSLNFMAGSGTAQAMAWAMLCAIKTEADGWGVRIGYNGRFALNALSALKLSLLEVRPLLSPDSAFRDYVMSQVSDEMVKSAIADYSALPPEQMTVQYQELANKLYLWNEEPTLRLCLGADSAPDIGAWLGTPGNAAFVSLGVSKLPAAGIIGKLLLAAVERYVMARSEVLEGQRNGFRFYIDEAGRVAGFGLETLLAEGRRMGCSIFLALQHMGMVEKPLRDALRANCSTKVLMAAGANEASEFAPEVVTDLTPSEVKKELVGLKVGEAIVVRRGEPAAKVRMPDFPVPRVPQSLVDSIRVEALARTGMSRKAAEDRANERADWIASLKPTDAVVTHTRRPKASGGTSA